MEPERTKTLDEAIAGVCADVEFPINVADLHTLDQLIHAQVPVDTNTYDSLFTLNYEAAQAQISSMRKDILKLLKDIVIEDISIERGLKELTP